MQWSYTLMHVVLAVSAVIVAGLAVWLAASIIGETRQRRRGD